MPAGPGMTRMSRQFVRSSNALPHHLRRDPVQLTVVDYKFSIRLLVGSYKQLISLLRWGAPARRAERSGAPYVAFMRAPEVRNGLITSSERIVPARRESLASRDAFPRWARSRSTVLGADWRVGFGIAAVHGCGAGPSRSLSDRFFRLGPLAPEADGELVDEYAGSSRRSPRGPVMFPLGSRSRRLLDRSGNSWPVRRNVRQRKRRDPLRKIRERRPPKHHSPRTRSHRTELFVLRADAASRVIVVALRR